jgi:hypothetical protein
MTRRAQITGKSGEATSVEEASEENNSQDAAK